MQNKNNDNYNQSFNQLIKSIKNSILVLECSNKRTDLQNITYTQEKN